MVVFVLAVIVNAEDVVVRQVAGHARFGQETRLGLLVLAARVRQNLHRHGASDDGVTGAVDVRHPAAQELLKLVLADSRRQLHYGLAMSATQPNPEK